MVAVNARGPHDRHDEVGVAQPVGDRAVVAVSVAGDEERLLVARADVTRCVDGLPPLHPELPGPQHHAGVVLDVQPHAGGMTSPGSLNKVVSPDVLDINTSL